MEQVVGKDTGQEKGDREQGTPELKEIDRLRLERLNLSISNINLQLALLNERARALQMEAVSLHMEREGLVKGITESYSLGNGWKLNPDTLKFENVGAGLVENPPSFGRAPAQKDK